MFSTYPLVWRLELTLSFRSSRNNRFYGHCIGIHALIRALVTQLERKSDFLELNSKYGELSNFQSDPDYSLVG
jgi:hypothetical protein